MPPVRLITALADIPDTLRGGAVAIGNFDGVHRGHKAVLDAAKTAFGPPRLALTFEPHPRAYFSGQPMFRLSPEAEKASLMASAGLDATVSLPFGAALAGQSAEAFVRDVLVDGLGARHVAIGFDFRFGKGRSGDAALLRRMGAEHGFDLTVVDAMADEGGAISSSRIREALGRGDIEMATALLGHRWRTGGKVVHGKQLGRTLGYPTANIALPPETGLAHGIYAVRATVDGMERAGVASFGRRPTFDNGPVLLETYVFDFEGDIYGQHMDVEFHAFLRGEKRFDGAEALVAQMDRDSEQARTILAEGGNA